MLLIAGVSQASATNPCVGNKVSSLVGSSITGATLNTLEDRDVMVYAMGVLDAFSVGAVLTGSSTQH